MGLIDSCQLSGDRVGMGFGEAKGIMWGQGWSQPYLGVGAIEGLSPRELPGPGGAPGGKAIGESIPDPAGRRVVSANPKTLHLRETSQKWHAKMPQNTPKCSPETA